MKETIEPLNFGTFIAYFLPGFIAFYSITYISDTAKMIFDTALIKGTQIGGSFLIFLASSIAGLIISSTRALILDNLCEIFCKIKPQFNWKSLIDASTLQAFKDTIENKYRFSQSYGNMFLSILLLFILKIVFTVIIIEKEWPILLLILITIVILFFCYKNSLKDTYKTINEILGDKTASVALYSNNIEKEEI